MRTLVTSLLLLITSFSISQNLVPNSSFEEYSTCPNIDNATDISYALYWTNPTDYSPDYFNTCDITTEGWYSIPSNGFGYQDAHSGNAYAGLITMIETDGREYIQCELLDSLVNGQLYCVEFYVSPSDSR